MPQELSGSIVLEWRRSVDETQAVSRARRGTQGRDVDKETRAGISDACGLDAGAKKRRAVERRQNRMKVKRCKLDWGAKEEMQYLQEPLGNLGSPTKESGESEAMLCALH
jgi:hypothetical protein